MQDNKREERELKRNLKKAGNKRVRKNSKQLLRENPEEAHWEEEIDYGKCSTKPLNKKEDRK